MRITKMLVLAALLGLIAAPAFAQPKEFSWQAINEITSPTNGYTVLPMGSWESGLSRVTIDPTGDPQGDPLRVSGYTISELVQTFSCTALSGGVPGCQVAITSQTMTSQGTNVSSTPSATTPLPGYTSVYDFDGGTVTPLFPPSLGQYCVAWIDPPCDPMDPQCAIDEATVSTFCADLLGYNDGGWSTNLATTTPLSPDQSGDWHFNADFSAYIVPDPYRYFELAGLPNLVYGRYLQVEGVSPRALPVPLAPLAALAMGGSLAYMGVSTLRRKR